MRKALNRRGKIYITYKNGITRKFSIEGLCFVREELTIFKLNGGNVKVATDTIDAIIINYEEKNISKREQSSFGFKILIPDRFDKVKTTRSHDLKNYKLVFLN